MRFRQSSNVMLLGKSMLTHSEMNVVIVMAETITPCTCGLQVTAARLSLKDMIALKVPQRRA